MTIVVKIGGAALEDAATLRKCARAIAELAQDGHRVAVVHGGGSALTRVLKQLGKQSEFIGGLRVTDAETRDVALMVLGGMVNKKMVAAIQAAGMPAVGFCGGDGMSVPRAARNMFAGTIWDSSARFVLRSRAGSKRCGSREGFRCWRRSHWERTANTTT